MHRRFRKHVDTLDRKVDELLALPGYTYEELPDEMPTSGIYLFSRGRKHLYVGRSNRIRKRIRNHCRPSATHYQASFAFRIAKKQLGIGAATYRPESSRSVLATTPTFARAFMKAKADVRTLSIRFVEEANPTRQALLEIYAAVRLATPYNDFDTH